MIEWTAYIGLTAWWLFIVRCIVAVYQSELGKAERERRSKLDIFDHVDILDYYMFIAICLMLIVPSLCATHYFLSRL